VKSTNTRYLVGIDHLRGFAACLIVFYHALHLLSFWPRAAGADPLRFWIHSKNPLIVLIEEGHTSVALFMVLSGFIFSVAALGKEVAYWPYLKNRFLRIYPLYFVMLCAGITALPGQYSASALGQALLFQADYTGSIDLGAYSTMFWAVAIEFQFYLVFPFLHRFIERDGVRWALAAIVLIVVLRWVASTDNLNPRDVSYRHVLGRMDQFLIGMLSARVFRRCERLSLPWGLVSLAAAALMLGLLVAFNQLGGYPLNASWKVLWPGIEALGWASVLVSYTLFASRVPAWLSQPLVGLGTISYSIYLLHFLCIVELPRWFPFDPGGRPNLAAVVYALKYVLPAVLPMAALTYYVVERPFLKLRVSYLRDTKPAPD
jgi:peptidoglycan/LPS O-acetylase OafA/YrhL